MEEEMSQEQKNQAQIYEASVQDLAQSDTQADLPSTNEAEANEAKSGSIEEQGQVRDESIVEEAVDWVEHEAALSMFEANQGIAWIKTKMHDGVVRMLGRNGETL